MSASFISDIAVVTTSSGGTITIEYEWPKETLKPGTFVPEVWEFMLRNAITDLQEELDRRTA
jgi:hypothetical protein